MINFIIIYLVIGALFTICTWFFDFLNKEYTNILIYFPIAVIAWPIVIVLLIYKYIKFLSK